MADNITKSRYYQFYDQEGKKFDVNADAFDSDMKGFSEAYPYVSMRMVDKDGEQWDIPVANVEKAMKEGGYRMWQWEQTHVNKAQKPPISQEQMQNSLQQRMYPNGQVPTEPIKREEPQQQPTGGYKPTWQEQMAFGSTLGGAQYAVDNATKGIDQMEQASKQASPFGSGNVGIGNNQSLRKGKQTFDAEKGAFVDTYLTSDGREFRDLQQANNAQADLDKIADSVRYEESLKAIGIDPSINLNDPNNLNHMLGDAYAERDAILKKMKDDKEGEQAVRDLIMSGGYDPTPNDKVDNRKTYQSALRMLERRINALETARDNGGFWGGTADVLSDPSNYSFGLTDLEDSKQMAKIKEKIDAARANGTKPQLSDSEKALARNYMLNQQAEQLNKDNWWYNAGKGFGQTLSFMKDFALTGGGFASIAKGGLAMGGAIGKKTAAKVLGEYMTKNIGTKALGKAIEYTGKGIGLAAGAEAGGFMLNNTVQAASNAADVINKQAGNLTVGDDGNLTFEGGKNLGMAVLKSQIERTGQNGSELVGLAFDAMPGIIGKVVQRTTVGKAIKKLTDNALWKKGEGLLNYLGVSSVWGEGMEEEYDMARTEILNRLTNGEYAPEGSGLFDLDRQIDTWKTVGLTSMILRVPSMVVSGTQAANYYANQYNLNASDKNMRSVFGDYDRYESVKSAIDGADNANIAGVLSGLITNAELSNEEKQAMFFYANDLIKVRGFNIGNVVAAVNGYTAPPKVASYQVKADGKSFDELDENGNVLAHHEYETNDEMKAGLYELQQQRFDDNLQSDISIMKTRPNGQFDQLVSDYLMQNEIFMMPSDFEAILNKPSLERTEEEQQLVASFSELLHNTVYDNTMLHEEQSQQDGEEIADADSIDIEAGSEQGAAINAEWQAAQQARNELFSRNEELAQEVLSRENNGLSHQEIISSLTTFRPEDVQAVIDFYNKKARYEGYINRKAQKIDEAAANSRQRHTMKGTIDGVADLNNVHTITDGTNRYYLVSGDITTDPATGRITGSTSGLIIGMDLDGSFVNLNESDGYSLEPVTMTLDQFEEAERTRLQEHITDVIDPNGLMNPQAEQPQPMNSGEQAGAQAGASTGTGANEAPAAPLSSEPQQPQVTIESVTDKDGIKRYEQGIPVDDAIADIQNDGFDVNEVADASIAEAQQAIEKIDKKSTKTRKDLMDKKSQQSTIDYYNNVKARWAEMNAEAQPAESEEIVNIQPEQPIVAEKTVSSQQNKSKAKTANEKQAERIKALKEQYGDDFDDDFTYAQTAEELASMYVGRNRTLSREDLATELGYPLGLGTDEVWAETLLAKKGEGLSTWDVAHAAWQSDENPIIDNEGNRKFTDKDIHDALISVFQNAKQKSDIMDYAINAREEAARQKAEARKRQEEEEAQEQQPLEPLTAEQLVDIENNLPFAQSTDEEIEDAPINQLRREVDVLMQEEGTPNIQLVDTERMTDDEWQELLSGMMGYFLSQEEIDDLRQNAIQQGVLYSPETGNITVLSGVVTPEDVRTKVEQIKEELSNEEVEQGTDGSSDEQSRGTDMGAVPAGNAQEDSAESEGKTGSTSTASEGSAESRVDDYLKPRNAEEEAIVQGVINQLQQEIQSATEEQNKARADLEKARTKESDRATDMFANDETFAEPDAIFSQEEMGLDTSAEGVDRRTAEQRDKLQEVTNKLNKLQSEQERNSRIRGALDNHRRQTRIETGEQPQTQSREDYLASHPLTEEQIMADTEANEDEKLNAIDFLNGEDSVISRFYYDQIYERTQKTSSSENRQKKEENEPVKEKKEEKPQQPQPKWQYQFHYDKETGRAWITRDDVSGAIPIGDGRFRIEGNSLAELRAILENPKNNLGELLKEVEAPLHNAEVGEQIRKAPTPTEAIEQAAQSFAQKQKSKDQQDIDDALKEFNDFLDNAKGSSVLNKFVRKGLEGNDRAQANLLNALTLTNEAQRMFLKDLLRLASKVGYAYIKSGVHDVQAWSKKMSDSIGAKLREVLGWDDNIIGEFVDEVWNQKYTVDGQRMRLSEHAERLKNTKPADQTVNVNKKESNEPENVVSSQQKADLQGDSAEFADRQKKIEKLRQWIKEQLDKVVFKGYYPIKMQDVKAYAKGYGLGDISLTDLQEMVEAEIVQMARDIAQTDNLNNKQKFEFIKQLYEKQPNLNARDNDRINKQQYSTPAPMAYLMGLFTGKGKKVESGLEPSAGNGMLTIGLPKEKMHVNDIDEMRLSNLQKQGFGQVTSQDGTQPFEQKAYDVVVTNPPFGTTTPKVYDGIYEISGLEHQMTINALESMKDDGRAAIIIGGNTEYNQNGSVKGKDRIFLNYLYAHYNVVDVINMNGHELYSRQGTGYPVRMILINGRKEFNPKSFAPVIQKARAERVNSYDELFKRVSDDILSNSNKPAGVHDTESGESNGGTRTADAGASPQTGVRNVQSGGSSKQPSTSPANRSGVQRGSNTTNKRAQESGNKNVGGGLFDFGSGSETNEPSGSATQQAEGKQSELGGNDTQRPTTGTDNSQRVGQRGAEPAQQPEQPAVKRGLGTEKVPYRKQSGNPFTLQSLMPAEQADVVKSALEELGDVDQFLVDELGYSSKEELHQALAAEQIDSVALAIHQMNQGNAFIIGDQTGIGKGRQAAALIRYGVKKGGFPVFITVKKALFSDMYRDLFDIGSPKLRPFIWSADDTEHSGNVTDKNGNVIYQTPSAKEQKRVVDYINKNGKLPPEYDYVLTTYDSFKSGTMDYEDGNKKARNFGKKKPGPVHFNGQAKRDALETLAQNSYVIMDESHNAGGEGSNVSNYLQYITTKAKGLTFLSATFAKRPGNMPIYSLKTAISKAGVKVGELIDAVKRGGATFQEIMSKALTEAGQMIRRERDMTGVTIDWKGIEDEDIIQKQREQYDTVIGLFNDIIQFQRTYVDPIVNGMNDDAAEDQGEVDHTPGTRDMGINNTPFASRTYNMVQQVLLSLKAEEAAKRAIEHLKLGRKPVITVANTNEGASDEVAGADGESMEMPDLSVNLKKGLQGTMRITKKDAFGNTVNEMIPFDRLSEEGKKRYAEIMDAIENASSGLSLSPIDVIKNELKKAGYKVGELTGRKAEFVYNEDGTVKRVKRQDTDKKRVASDFNNGKIDALILNRSAGTGISLHASSTFTDQRQRIMIVAQAQGDVNDEVQIRGRIDRTGQVLRGMYEYVVSQIPSEQRLLMMLKAKLRSLDANTTSSQKSKFNEMQVQDIINKYGDDIVIQYLAEHPDLAMKMCDPLKWGEGAETLAPETLISQAQKAQGDGATASKVLGRMALLKVAEQEKMLAEIGALYQAEIDRLNEMGENDLEITEMPLRAKTVKKNVWEEGVEPGGKNPFADNSYVEEVEMDVLRKPMKAEEVKKAQDRLLGGKTWDEYKKDVYDKINEWADKKKEETAKTFTERAEKKATAEKEKYAKGAKKAQEKNGMTDEEIERNAGYQYDTFYKQEMEKLDNAIEAIDKQKQVFVDALETFSTERVYALPTDIYDLSQLTFEPSFGRVIDIDIKEDNYSTTASTITFATLDGRRKVTIPISGMVKQNNGEKKDIKPVIVQQTAQTRSGFFGSNIKHMLDVLELDLPNWDRLTSTATRKKGYIITGNLLKALTSLRKQGKGGKLISYTTDKEEIRQGILMGDKFDPGTLTSKNPISSAKKDLDDFNKDNKIVSADGNITVKRGRYDWRNNAYSYTLQVPKSKKRGDMYFNDKTLLSLMEGQFEGSTKMSADFPLENLDAVLKRLDELGVTVESAKEDSDAPKRMITTSDPMRAIEQAADSWRSEKGRSLLRQIADFVSDIPTRFGLKGAAPTYAVNSLEDLESLKDIVSKEVFDEIEKLYNEPDTGSAYLPKGDIVVIFGEHLDSVDEAEEAWWHEQVHAFWGRMPNDARDRIGQACYEWLRANRPDIYMHIRTEYKDSERLEESCAFFIGNVIVSRIGTERLLKNNLENSEEIRTFANKLINHLQNGREEKGSNQPGRAGKSGQTSTTQVRRGISQEREGRDNSSRSETESELQEVTDPIRAIELSAKRWKKRKAEREEDIKALDEYSAKQVYHDRIDRVETMFAESWQDDMVTFKAGQDAIAHDKDIPDSQNAYMAANLAHGKVYNEQEKFTNFFKNPLIEAINKILKATGWRMGDIDRYVFTKHGLERNREFYVRDFMNSLRSKTIRSIEDLNADEQEIFRKKEEKLHEQFDDGTIETEEELNKKLTKALKDAHSEYMNNLQEEYDKIKQDRYVDLQEGKITFPEYLSAIDDFIFSNIDGDYVPEEHDYSGFTEMYGDEEGNYNENAIIEELMVNEEVMGEGNMKELWNRINLISAYGLDSYRKSGMTSDDTSKRISNMFHWYVPMRGFGNSQAAEDHWQYMTHNDGQAAHIGGLLKSAKGRKSEANYPIATLIGMTLKAIGDCEQNMVKQKLWRLCQANPNDLIVTSEAWVVLDPVSGEWITAYPEIDSDMTGPMVEAKVKEFNERMHKLDLEGNAKRIKGKEHFDYKVDSKNRSEHVIEVKLNGERKLMIVTGNPRMALAINGQLRYEGGKSIFAKANTALKQFMQSMSTSFNLTFVGRNMMRDLTHFSAILITREGTGYVARAEKYYMEQLPKMKSLFKKYREGTLDENKEVERDFKDFMDNGGITGFVHMQKVERYQKEMEKLFKEKNAGKPIKINNKVWECTLGAIEAMNEAIENNARFATYRASRHYAGRTKARSAYDAKEVTVNFNKKGAGRKTADFKSDKMKVRAAAKVFGSTGQLLAANKMFFNATIQAICTIFKTFQNKDGSINWPYVGKFVSLYAAPQFAMGLLMPFINDTLLAMAGGDDGDDPYANLPEWVRRKNLCIYLGWVPRCGKNDFLLIPLGQELAAFYSLGDMAAGLTYKPNIRPLDRSLDDEILGFFSVFSPVDFDTKVTGNEHFAPVSEYVGRVSSVAAPLVAIGENTSWMGRPIFRDDRFPNDKYAPEYQMVFSNTNAQFVQFSEWLNNISGGDDVKRGAIQINPATMQYLVEQYTGGPGKLFANTLVSAGKDVKEFVTTGEAMDFNIRKIEGVRAFYQQSDERNQFYRIQSKYRKYKEDAQEVGYQIRQYSKDAKVNPEHKMELEKLKKGKDAARYNLLFGEYGYDKALKQLNTRANEATGKERKHLRTLYNQKLKQAVDDLDKVREISTDTTPNQ